MSTLIKNETLSEATIIELREHFVNTYCQQQGWDKYNLTFEQVLQIREHKEWKSPGMLRS
jgi:tRNA 2-selenouridine synthase SelU